MTIKEYAQSKSANIEFSDLKIKGILFSLARYSGCVQPEYADRDISTLLNEDITKVLTVKGMDLMQAEIYMLLSSYVGETESVTRGTTSISTSNSFGVNDRRNFREMAERIFRLYGVIEDDSSDLEVYNSFAAW